MPRVVQVAQVARAVAAVVEEAASILPKLTQLRAEVAVEAAVASVCDQAVLVVRQELLIAVLRPIHYLVGQVARAVITVAS